MLHMGIEMRADGMLNINLYKVSKAQAILFSCRIFRRSMVLWSRVMQYGNNNQMWNSGSVYYVPIVGHSVLSESYGT